MQKHEQEFKGPIWKHPFMVYVLFTIPLFLFLLLMAWLAWTNGWLPKR